jgi:hypothetical protein
MKKSPSVSKEKAENEEEMFAREWVKLAYQE